MHMQRLGEPSCGVMDERAIETWAKIVLTIVSDEKDDYKCDSLREIERFLSSMCPMPQTDVPSPTLPNHPPADFDAMSADRRQCHANVAHLRHELDEAKAALLDASRAWQVERERIDSVADQALRRTSEMARALDDQAIAHARESSALPIAEARHDATVQASARRLQALQATSNAQETALQQTTDQLHSAQRRIRVVEQQNGELMREMRQRQNAEDERRTQTERAHSSHIEEMAARLRDAMVRSRVECDERLAARDESHERRRLETELLDREKLDAAHATLATQQAQCAAKIASLTTRAKQDAAALVETTTNERNALAERLDALERHNSACQAEWSRARRDYEKCAEELTRLHRSNQATNSQLEDTATQLHAQLGECQSRLQTAERATDDALSQWNDATLRQRQCQERLERAETHATLCTKRLVECEARYTAQSADARATHAQWAQFHAEAVQQLASKQAEYDALNTHLAVLEHGAATLQSEYATIHDQHAKSVREVASLRRASSAQSADSDARLQAQVVEHERTQKELRDRLEECNRRIHSLQDESENCLQRLAEANAEVEAEKMARAEVESQHARQMVEMQAEVQQLASEYTRHLDAVHAQWTQRHEETVRHLESKQAECDALTARLAGLENEEETLRSAHATLSKRHAQVVRESNVQSADSDARLAALHAQLDDHVRLIESVQGESDHCRLRLHEAQAELVAEQNARYRDREEVHALTEQLERASTALDALEYQHRVQQERLIESEQSLNLHVAELASVRAQYDDYMREDAMRLELRPHAPSVEHGTSPMPPAVASFDAPRPIAPRKRRRSTPDVESADVDESRVGRMSGSAETTLEQRLRESEALVQSARAERDEERVMLSQRTSDLAEATRQLHGLQDYIRRVEALASPVEALAPPVDGVDVHRDEARAPEDDGDPSSSDLNVADEESWNDTNRSWCANSTVVKSNDSLRMANKTLDDVSCQCYAQHNISCRSAHAESKYPLRCVAIGDLSPCERGRRFSGKATCDGKKDLFFKLGRYSTTQPQPDQTRSFTDGSVIEENRVFLAQEPPDDTKTTRKLRSSSHKKA
jgi:chromosome segregation ATPase